MSAGESTIATRLKECQEEWEYKATATVMAISTLADVKALEQSLDAHVTYYEDLKAHMSKEETEQLEASNLYHDQSLSGLRSDCKDFRNYLQLREWSQQWITMTMKAIELGDQGQTVNESLSKCQDVYI